MNASDWVDLLKVASNANPATDGSKTWETIACNGTMLDHKTPRGKMFQKNDTNEDVTYQV